MFPRSHWLWNIDVHYLLLLKGFFKLFKNVGSTWSCVRMKKRNYAHQCIPHASSAVVPVLLAGLCLLGCSDDMAIYPCHQWRQSLPSDWLQWWRDIGALHHCSQVNWTRWRGLEQQHWKCQDITLVSVVSSFFFILTQFQALPKILSNLDKIDRIATIWLNLWNPNIFYWYVWGTAVENSSPLERI